MGCCEIVQREDGRIEMFSRKQKSHHVLWFPNELKDHFVVTFRVKNLNVKAGLLMALFHARGLKGESVFVPDLVKRRHLKKRVSSLQTRTHFHVQHLILCKHTECT